MSNNQEGVKQFFVAFDGEMSGLHLYDSQMISCGAIFLDADQNEIERCEWLINYDQTQFSHWDEESALIHRIPLDQARTHGIQVEGFLNEFHKKIVKHYGWGQGQRVHFIGANAYFDFLIFENMWRKYRSDPCIISYRTVDLSSLGFLLVGSAGLSSLAKKLGVPLDEEKKHNAMYDTNLHFEVYKKLKALVPKSAEENS
ncbi:MAG: exonuclease domain-containing protein [Alphaproteobacteria bacterium]|nr:exonuclease domain-containing protein [Alphaproteobacteria bacterium]